MGDAVMLPSETAAAPGDIVVSTDETLQADRLNVFNDSSTTNDTGVLQAIDFRDNGFLNLGEADGSRTAINLSGLGMSGDKDVEISDTQIITISGGITFDDIEVTELLLGKGADNLTINDTSKQSFRNCYTGSSSTKGFARSLIWKSP